MRENKLLLLCSQGNASTTDASTGDLAHLLQHSSVGPQLQRLSFAFSSCLLCIEGSNTFEYKLAEHLSKVYAMARHSGISLQYTFSSGQSQTEVCDMFCNT